MVAHATNYSVTLYKDANDVIHDGGDTHLLENATKVLERTEISKFNLKLAEQ